MNVNTHPQMRLLSIEYGEYPREPRQWTLSETEFGDTNLIVGRNATGKTRALKLIANLARLLTGIQREMFGTAHFHAKIEIESERFEYWLLIEGRRIQFEQLEIDGVRKFQRDDKGEGEIYAEELRSNLKFKVEDNVVVALAKIDSIQHPYLAKLHAWASGVRLFEFGTSLGRDSLLLAQDASGSAPKTAARDPILETTNTVGVVKAGLDSGPKFKKRLLQDLAAFGFPCEDIGIGPAVGVEASSALVGIYVHEKGLHVPNFQLMLSQGFFRALALMASVNLFAIRNEARTILIDDIGEGLDYERSKAVIGRLMKVASGKLQLIMTSNDRFIMNAVPLECWTVLDRVDGRVTPFNSKNSELAFKEFAALGLNNFDFFATESYKAKKRVAKKRSR